MVKTPNEKQKKRKWMNARCLIRRKTIKTHTFFVNNINYLKEIRIIKMKKKNSKSERKYFLSFSI